MEYAEQPVVIETAHHRVVGRLTLPKSGFRSRLSDFLNRSDTDFLSVSDATVEPLDGNGPTEHRDFVAVARNHIVLVCPVEGD